ncbi:MAG: hypothetical protein ACLQDY_23400 [Streptosporangiaceae bacterium]
MPRRQQSGLMGALLQSWLIPGRPDARRVAGAATGAIAYGG